MAISSYSDLVAKISDYLGRDDLTQEQINTFIQFAEQVFNRDLRIREMEVAAQWVLPGGTATYNLPANYLELKDLGFLQNHMTYVPLYSMGRDTVSGSPYEFAVVGSTIKFYPVPTYDTTFDVVYYAAVTGLSNSNASNAILIKAPDAYLYGALLQATAWARTSAPIPLWNAAYEAAIGSLKRSDRAAKTSPMPTMRPIRRVKSKSFSG